MTDTLLSDFSVAFPIDRSFDKRRLLITDDGADFEQFVFEALARRTDFAGLRRNLSRGRDGAIDLLSEGDGENVVIESKFIGLNATSTPESRWGEVRRHLNDNLPGLAKRPPEKQTGSPYAPWLDRDRPITRYVFCVSRTFPSHQSRLRVEKQITQELVEILDKVRPNIEIKVDVLGWDDFHQIISGHYPLRYRWFGDLPDDLRPLNPTRRELSTFRSFLHSTHLPYFSRAQYIQSTGLEAQWKEDDLTADLQSNGECLIVHGPGGVGKTRLATELCRLLEDQGWIGIRLLPSTREESLRQLVRAHTDTARLVLFADYAEIGLNISNIGALIAQLNEQGHNLRLIATCRTGALTIVRKRLAEIPYKEVLLSNRGEGWDVCDYSHWVVARIIDYANLPDPEKIAALCGQTPALAAFAAFVHKTDPVDFRSQFSNLSQLRDFQDWITSRINHICQRLDKSHARTSIERQLALISLQIPLSLSSRYELARDAETRQVLESLELDRWIASDGQEISSAHDIFMDSLVSNYLFATEEGIEIRFYDLFRTALEYNFLDRALPVFDRISTQPLFWHISHGTEAVTLLEQHPAELHAHYDPILTGRVLSSESKLKLLSVDKSLLDIAASNEKLALIFSDVLANRTAVEVDFSVIEHWLSMSGSTTVARIVYESWLEADGDLVSIEPYVRDWLANSEFSQSSIYLFKMWIEKGGDFAFLRSGAKRWLDAFGCSSMSQRGLCFWLDNGGGTDEVRPYLEKWLPERGRKQISQFVFTSWLRAGGDLPTIQTYLFEWFEENWWREDATFALKRLCRLRTLPDNVMRAAVRWCARFRTNIDAAWRISSLAWSNEESPFALAIARTFILIMLEFDYSRLQKEVVEASIDHTDEKLARAIVETIGWAYRVVEPDEVDLASLQSIHKHIINCTDTYELACLDWPIRDSASTTRQVALMMKDAQDTFSLDGLKHFARAIEGGPKQARGVNDPYLSAIKLHLARRAATAAPLNPHPSSAPR